MFSISSLKLALVLRHDSLDQKLVLFTPLHSLMFPKSNNEENCKNLLES